MRKRYALAFVGLATMLLGTAVSLKLFLSRHPEACVVAGGTTGCRDVFRMLSRGNPTDVRCALSAPTRTVTFFSADSLRLVADLFLPKGSGPHPAVVLLHGSSTVGRRMPLNAVLARQLQGRGYAVLTHDQRGFGESADPPNPHSLASFDWAGDVSKAVDVLMSETTVQPGRLFVIGHSFAGGVALAAPAREPRIRKLVLIGPSRRIQERFLASNAPDSAYATRRAVNDMQLPKEPTMQLWRPLLELLDIARYIDDYASPGHLPLFLIDSAEEDPQDLAFLRQVHEQMRPDVAYWTVPASDHYLTTARLLGQPCYNQRVMGQAVARIDAWLGE